MPIFLAIIMLTIIEVWWSIEVLRGQLKVTKGHARTAKPTYFIKRI